MAHDVQPLAVPSQDTGPQLDGLEEADLAAEGAVHGAEPDLDGAGGLAPRCVLLGAHGALHGAHAARAQRRQQVAARDVEVGEVAAVGFVQVVVAFEGGGARGGY